MKTPALFVALLLASSLSHAQTLRCVDLFSTEGALARAFARVGPMGGAESKVEAWDDARGFDRMLTEHEKMGTVASVFDKKLDTRIYYTATALPDSRGNVPMIDPRAEAVVIFLHGSGTSQSGGANYIHNMNGVAKVGVAGISVDLPFHSEGSTKNSLNDLNKFMNWMHDLVGMAKASGKPVYLFGHSFSPEIMAEYAYRWPFDLAGLDLVSMVGINPTLENWQRRYTDKMKFGGEVPENTLGGEWAARISEQLTWNKSGGSHAPTLVNPNLKVEILWGDREEYAPAPIGGKNKTPIGRNTYDLPAAIRPYFPGANITIARDVGHYIFNHVDTDGGNTVMNSIYRMLGIKGTEVTREKAIIQRNGSMSSTAQLQQMLATNKIFKSWLMSTNQLSEAQGLSRSENQRQAAKVIQAFNEAFSARVVALRHQK